MKKNGLAFFIVLIVVALLVGIGVLFLRFYKPAVLINNSLSGYGVVAKNTFDVDSLNFSYVDKKQYIVYNGDFYGVVDINNNTILDYEYEKIEGTSTGYIAYKIGFYYLFDLEGNILLESPFKLYSGMDSALNKNYYYTNEFKKIVIYDDSGKYLYTLENFDDYFSIVGNYIIDSEQSLVINYKTEEKISIKEHLIIGKYLMLRLVNNKYMLVNLETNESDYYDKFSENGYSYVFKNSSKQIILNIFGEVIDNADIFKINENYTLDYSICEFSSFNIYYKDKKINDGCYELYEYDFNKHGGLVVYNYDKQITEVFFVDGSSAEFYFDEISVGYDFISFYDFKVNKYFLYNLNGEKFENVCKNLVDINKEKKVCYDFSGAYIVDNELEKISDTYKDIECNENGACLVKDFDNKYGLMIDNEMMIEPTYYSAYIDDKYVGIEKQGSFDLLELGESNNLVSKEELAGELFNIEKDISVNDVIKEYSLESNKDLIYQNEELFKKYAYIILTNKKVNGYRKELLDMFNVVVLNKDYLDEEYLLFNLGKLSISRVSELVNENAAGTYSDGDKAIELKSVGQGVIKHEIMHFFDYNMNFDIDNGIYYCDNKYYSKEELRKLEQNFIDNCKPTIIPYSNFIIEAGAEVNMSRYVGNSARTYDTSVNVYYALNYIFGEEFMNKVYFAKDGDLMLLNEMTKYITYDEYYSFIEKMINITDINTGNDVEDIKDVLKILIKLYGKRMSGNWYDDKEFVFTMSAFLQCYDYSKFSDVSQYVSKIPKIMNEVDKIIAEIDGFSSSSSVTLLTEYNGDSFIHIMAYDMSSQIVNLKLRFDFKNWKVLDTYVYLYD